MVASTVLGPDCMSPLMVASSLLAKLPLDMQGIPKLAAFRPYLGVASTLLARTLFTMCSYTSITAAATSLGTPQAAAHQVTLQLFWFLSCELAAIGRLCTILMFQPQISYVWIWSVLCHTCVMSGQPKVSPLGYVLALLPQNRSFQCPIYSMVHLFLTRGAAKCLGDAKLLCKSLTSLYLLLPACAWQTCTASHVYCKPVGLYQNLNSAMSVDIFNSAMSVDILEL